MKAKIDGILAHKGLENKPQYVTKFSSGVHPLGDTCLFGSMCLMHSCICNYEMIHWSVHRTFRVVNQHAAGNARLMPFGSSVLQLTPYQAYMVSSRKNSHQCYFKIIHN